MVRPRCGRTSTSSRPSSHDCVDGGASVSYMAPFPLEQARSAFEGFVAEAEQGRRLVLAAFLDGDLVGTVQVILALPPNQPHRAEIAKLLVHRRARGRGIAQQLMEHAEAEARAEGKTLLVLDAVTGGMPRVSTRAWAGPGSASSPASRSIRTGGRATRPTSGKRSSARVGDADGSAAKRLSAANRWRAHRPRHRSRRIRPRDAAARERNRAYGRILDRPAAAAVVGTEPAGIVLLPGAGIDDAKTVLADPGLSL